MDQDLKLPFFSLLIPSYNRPESLAGCIESILANDEQDFEIIISDDASPSAEAVEKSILPYLARANIVFHKQSHNLGEPANRNFLVSQAGGQYNIILCDDDRLLPHALRTLRSCISRVPGQDVYLFGYQVVDAAGRRCYDRAAPAPLSLSVDEPKLVRRILEAIWLPFLVCHPSTFCSRRGVETSTPYRNDVSIADDYMFLVDCLNRGKRLHVLPECLMQYRWAPSLAAQTNQSADNLKVVRAFAKVYYALRGHANIHPVLSTIIRSTDYRKRFLYDFIIRRGPRSSDLTELGLEGDHGHEFARYARRVTRLLVTLRIPMTMVAELTEQFGLRGFGYSMKVVLMYLRYRVLPLTPKMLSTSDV